MKETIPEEIQVGDKVIVRETIARTTAKNIKPGDICLVIDVKPNIYNSMYFMEESENCMECESFFDCQRTRMPECGETIVSQLVTIEGEEKTFDASYFKKVS